jgi:hypothetical protein
MYKNQNCAKGLILIINQEILCIGDLNNDDIESDHKYYYKFICVMMGRVIYDHENMLINDDLK